MLLLWKMEAKKGMESTAQKYHPFLLTATKAGGWLVGEVNNSKSLLRPQLWFPGGFISQAQNRRQHTDPNRKKINKGERPR